MNDKTLDRTLRSIGKACFVNYFTKLSDLSLSDEAVARILVERKDGMRPQPCISVCEGRGASLGLVERKMHLSC